MKSFLVLVLIGCAANPSGGPDGGTHGDGHAGDAARPDAGTSLAELRFAILGDTRPPSPDDTANYPTAVITKIWQDIEAESPHPQFAISTGDYVFASTNRTEQIPQFDKYLAARAVFSGMQYPAFGNHECTGATASNCGPGSIDGITPNMTDFIQKMLTPIGVSQVYYTEKFTAQDNSWSAKFVFVACNAWNATQASWLATALSDPTTYTFVVRHEGVAALSQTPCAASQSIITAHPLTLMIVGHTHEYRHYASDHEVIVGNGGAPLTTGTNYGYVIVTRNASGTLTVTAYDYMSHAVMDTFTIQASGAAA